MLLGDSCISGNLYNVFNGLHRLRKKIRNSKSIVIRVTLICEYTRCMLSVAVLLTNVKPAVVVTANGGWSDVMDDLVDLTLQEIFKVEEVQESYSDSCQYQQYKVDYGKNVATKSCTPTRLGSLVVSSIVVVLCLYRRCLCVYALVCTYRSICSFHGLYTSIL